MPKVEIYADEEYPVYSIYFTIEENTGKRLFQTGSCDVPDEFIKEYEEFLKHYENIQDRLRTYSRNGDIEKAKEELCKYVDADTAVALSSKYGSDDWRMVFNIRDKEKELRYVIFESRVAIKRSTAEKEAALKNMVKEWILNTYKEPECQ